MHQSVKADETEGRTTGSEAAEQAHTAPPEGQQEETPAPAAPETPASEPATPAADPAAQPHPESTPGTTEAPAETPAEPARP